MLCVSKINVSELICSNVSFERRKMVTLSPIECIAWHLYVKWNEFLCSNEMNFEQSISVLQELSDNTLFPPIRNFWNIFNGNTHGSHPSEYVCARQAHRNLICFFYTIALKSIRKNPAKIFPNIWFQFALIARNKRDLEENVPYTPHTALSCARTIYSTYLKY